MCVATHFFTDSSAAVFMRLPGLTPVFFISGHLSATSRADDFQKTLGDLQRTIDAAPAGCNLAIGIDANDVLEGVDQANLRVGIFTGDTLVRARRRAVGNWKGQALFRLMCANNLTAANCLGA